MRKDEPASDLRDMTQTIEKDDEVISQVETEPMEALGVFMAQEFEAIVDRMFALMLDESKEDSETRENSAPLSRVAGR